MPRISTLPLNDRAAAKDELPAVDVAESTTKKLTVDMIMPTGAILDFAGPNAPEGWLLCYGQTLNATANPIYAELFAAIGTTYGGTGINSFNLPDLRGRVVAGQDDMGGTSANRLTNPAAAGGGVDGDVLGGAGGSETHTMTIAQMPSHTHDTTNRGGWGAGPANGSRFRVDVNSPANNWGPDIVATGGGNAHNNVQPTIILNKIIKY